MSRENQREIMEMLLDLKVVIRLEKDKICIDPKKLNDFGYRIVMNRNTRKPQLQPNNTPVFMDDILANVDRCKFDSSLMDQFSLSSIGSRQDFFEDLE